MTRRALLNNLVARGIFPGDAISCAMRPLHIGTFYFNEELVKSRAGSFFTDTPSLVSICLYLSKRKGHNGRYCTKYKV